MVFLDWLLKLDHDLFFRVNGMSAWEPVAETAALLSDFGRYAVVLAAALFLAMDGWSAFKKRALAFLLIAPLAVAANIGLKESVARQRPLGHFRKAVRAQEVTILAGESMSKRSFPSGHTTLAFFSLGYVALVKRRQAAGALALAAAISWSRMAMGSHFPSDCAAGVILGLFWAWTAWRLFHYLEHAAWIKRDTTAPLGSGSGSCSAS
jgi:membrane-associated phospholipid phosphatase